MSSSKISKPAEPAAFLRRVRPCYSINSYFVPRHRWRRRKKSRSSGAYHPGHGEFRRLHPSAVLTRASPADKRNHRPLTHILFSINTARSPCAYLPAPHRRKNGAWRAPRPYSNRHYRPSNGKIARPVSEYLSASCCIRRAEIAKYEK